MLKFIQQLDVGSGDYTKEREKLLGNPTIDEIKDEIEQIKNLNPGSGESNSRKNLNP